MNEIIKYINRELRDPACPIEQKESLKAIKKHFNEVDVKKILKKNFISKSKFYRELEIFKNHFNNKTRYRDMKIHNNKLTSKQKMEIKKIIEKNSPYCFGLPRARWTSKLLKHYILREYGVYMCDNSSQSLIKNICPDEKKNCEKRYIDAIEKYIDEKSIWHMESFPILEKYAILLFYNKETNEKKVFEFDPSKKTKLKRTVEKFIDSIDEDVVIIIQKSCDAEKLWSIEPIKNKKDAEKWLNKRRSKIRSCPYLDRATFIIKPENMPREDFFKRVKKLILRGKNEMKSWKRITKKRKNNLESNIYLL